MAGGDTDLAIEQLDRHELGRLVVEGSLGSDDDALKHGEGQGSGIQPNAPDCTPGCERVAIPSFELWVSFVI